MNSGGNEGGREGGREGGKEGGKERGKERDLHLTATLLLGHAHAAPTLKFKD